MSKLLTTPIELKQLRVGNVSKRFLYKQQCKITPPLIERWSVCHHCNHDHRIRVGIVVSLKASAHVNNSFTSLLHRDYNLKTKAF